MTTNTMTTHQILDNEYVSTNPQTEQLTESAAEPHTDRIAQVSNVLSLYGSNLPPEFAATLLATSPHLAIRRNYQIQPSKEQLLDLGFTPEVAELQPLLLAPTLGGTQHVVELSLSGIDTGLTPPSFLPAGLPACVDAHPGNNVDAHDISRPLVLTDRVSVSDLFATRGYATVTLLGAERWPSEGGVWPEMRTSLKRVADRDIYFALSCDIESAKYLRQAMDGLSDELGARVGYSNFYKMQLPLKPDGTRQDYNEYFLRGGTVDQLVSRADCLLKYLSRPSFE